MTVGQPVHMEDCVCIIVWKYYNSIPFPEILHAWAILNDIKAGEIHLQNEAITNIEQLGVN